jgi:competence protein ComFC
MLLITAIYRTVVDALFPLSAAELELFQLSPEEAWDTLTKAPAVPVEDATAIFAYKDERVSKLVWNIKYKKSETAARIGGYALFKKLSEMNLPGGSVITPMPITKRRRKERGFNQCELLVNEVARLDTEKKFMIEAHILIRSHHSSRQTLKGREERLESAKGIFSVNSGLAAKYKDRRIIVIDDVITTGSTITEAIHTLKAAGLQDVYGLSVAH